MNGHFQPSGQVPGVVAVGKDLKEAAVGAAVKGLREKLKETMS